VAGDVHIATQDVQHPDLVALILSGLHQAAGGVELGVAGEDSDFHRSGPFVIGIGSRLTTMVCVASEKSILLRVSCAVGCTAIFNRVERLETKVFVNRVFKSRSDESRNWHFLRFPRGGV
jgi:hypothetical protein